MTDQTLEDLEYVVWVARLLAEGLVSEQEAWMLTRDERERSQRRARRQRLQVVR